MTSRGQKENWAKVWLMKNALGIYKNRQRNRKHYSAENVEATEKLERILQISSRVERTETCKIQHEKGELDSSVI